MNQHISLAIDSLNCSRSDSLARARAAFKSMSAEEMKKEHGQSGMTRAEILKIYESHEQKINDAIQYLEKMK